MEMGAGVRGREVLYGVVGYFYGGRACCIVGMAHSRVRRRPDTGCQRRATCSIHIRMPISNLHAGSASFLPIMTTGVAEHWRAGDLATSDNL